MPKANNHRWSALYTAISCSIFALVPISLVYAAPTITITPQVSTATSTEYVITLTNNGDIFNMIEFNLLFASSTQIETGSVESELCRPELTLENSLATSTGSWYVACGNFVPFSGISTTLATFTVIHSLVTPSFSFGDNTALYRHDGLGTRIAPDTTGLGGATG
jgi:hypothetical protein